MLAFSRRLLAISLLLAAPVFAAHAAPVPPKPPARPASGSTTGKPAGTVPARPAAPTHAAARPATQAPAKRGSDTSLDAIAAMVNDEPVLASDVEEQLFLFLQQSQAHPDSSQVDTLRRQVLDQLINDKLILGEAKKQNISVSPAEVARQVENAVADAKERFGGDPGFQDQLQRENTTEGQLRDRFRGNLVQQLTEKRLVDKMFPRKTVSQPEAEAYFNAHREKFPKVPAQLKLQVIQITPSPDSASLAAGKAKIEAIRKRILAGEKFAKVAADASDDPGTAKQGGDLGFFKRGAMEPAIENAAFSQANGALSAPVRTVFGWHLVEPIERDTVKMASGKDSLDADGKPVLEVHARHILVKVTPSDADVDRATELASKVRDQAAKGADYTTLVKKYSTYMGPAGPDGDVGFLSLAQMQTQIRAGLENLKVGDVSEVLTNAQGFNIFKVNDRKSERPYEVSEIKDELPTAVSEAQFREKYDAWVKTLRSKAQIEYRDH